MIPVNVVFQGGGAKLATLIAACELIEDLEAEGLISVNASAGTSAGAIAACILASKESSNNLRLRINAGGAKFIERLKGIGLFSFLFNNLRGLPPYPTSLISDFALEIFRKEKHDQPTLASLRFPVYIQVSDIRNGCGYIYKDENTPLEKALSESCAIPFVFTSYKSSNQYVDGAITSNLIDISYFPDVKSKLIVFSFEKDSPYSFNGLLSYCKSIVSTAISESVSRTTLKFKNEGHFVCLLPNNFRTFDFEAAFNVGLSDDAINSVKSQIRPNVEEAIRQFERDERQRNLKDKFLDLNKFVSNYSKSISKLHPHRVIRNKIVCIAHGLNKKSIKTSAMNDVLMKDVEIEALGESLFSFKIGITKEDTYSIEREMGYRIIDAHGNQIEAELEVVESIQQEKTVWHALFCLKSPIPKSATPIRVQLRTSHTGIMDGLLRSKGTDWMRAESHQDDAVAQQDFVLCFPKKIGPLRMVDLLENVHRTMPRLNEEDMAGRWIVGNRMQPSELSEYAPEIANLPGFDLIGWRVKDVPPGSYCGVLVERE